MGGTQDRDSVEECWEARGDGRQGGTGPRGKWGTARTKDGEWLGVDGCKCRSRYGDGTSVVSALRKKSIARMRTKEKGGRSRAKDDECKWQGEETL